jgi:hypothetical protein
MKWRMVIFVLLISLVAGCGSVAPSANQSDAPLPQTNEQEPVQPQVTAQPQESVAQQISPVTPPDSVSLYNGPVEHIFFHPLIAYPERAFDGDSLAKGYNDWFVTVPEFKRILEQLYRNQFILIDIRSLYEETAVNGQSGVHPKPLLLPKDKKPLVLSIDDLNYYDYMIENGNVSRLVLNQAGQVVTESADANGAVVVSDDNDIVPILDRFVREHPDFSDHGAKGLIALTGYQGVLGYRTNDKVPEKAALERDAAAAVIRRLKETGWSFASHGWGHLDAQKISLQRLVTDTEHWKSEVEPLIGATPVYVYPFGSQVQPDSDKFKALQREGFSVFCSVGPTPYMEWRSGTMLTDRRHVDGLALQTQRNKLLSLFDAGEVLDPIRAKLNAR